MAISNISCALGYLFEHEIKHRDHASERLQSVDGKVDEYELSQTSPSSRCSDSSYDDVDFYTLLQRAASTDEQIHLIECGFRLVNKIRETKQGELLLAINLQRKSKCNDAYAVIKKVEKKLIAKNELKDGMDASYVYITHRHLMCEAAILRQLMHPNIVSYLTVFENEQSVYLVTQYVEDSVVLNEFTVQFYQLLMNGIINLNAYRLVMKCILQQIACTLNWMHNYKHCCHLNLCCSNIVVSGCNVETICDSDTLISYAKDIRVVICDFSCAKIFVNEHFDCAEYDETADNAAYACPQIRQDELFDARAADVWSYGMIMFECLTGRPLYVPEQMFDHQPDECLHSYCGYHALYQGRLKDYIANICDDIDMNAIDILQHALDMDQVNRPGMKQICKHHYFK